MLATGYIVFQFSTGYTFQEHRSGNVAVVGLTRALLLCAHLVPYMLPFLKSSGVYHDAAFALLPRLSAALTQVLEHEDKMKTRKISALDRGWTDQISLTTTLTLNFNLLRATLYTIMTYSHTKV